MDVVDAFEWDTANIAHLARHGITPEEAEFVVRNDPRQLGVELRNGEIRRTELGRSEAGRILVVVSTARAYKIRVVTG